MLVSFLALAACSPAQDALSLQPREIEAGDVTFQAEIGYLRVPENRLDPKSRTIELGMALLHSTADEPGPPLFFLAGGPGNAATPLSGNPTWVRFLELGDVVLLDQRGVGESRPELVWETDAVRPGLLFGDRETAMAHIVEVGELAAKHYADQGVDLTGYTTVQSADDVNDLRIALGAEKIRLMGHSYGTHLGLAILRRHGEHVERFVSVASAGTGDIHKLPGELDESLRQLAELVEADPAWSERFPDFFAAVEGVLAAVDEEPLECTVRDPRSGAEVDVALGRFGLQLLLVADLADTSDLPVFPLLIATIEERDPRLATWFLQKRYTGFTRVPVLMFVARGASGATSKRWERIAREASTSPFGSVRTLFSPEIDGALGTPDLGDEFRAPVTSDVPTLFISGTLDASTPPDQAERIRESLGNTVHVVLEYAGHDELMRRPEAQQRILAFLAGEELEDEFLPAPRPWLFIPPDGDMSRVAHPSLGR